jgi:CheY-like chemotaxis protein
VSTVLIVQSDPELNYHWRAALESSGHAVLAARGAPDGIDRVREGGIDLVVFDCPADREDLTRFVAALERLPDAPPFVLVSSNPAVPKISAQLGAAAFLPKPCTPTELGSVCLRLAPIY